MFLMQLCKLISENPDKITSIDCEAVIRHGIKKYTDTQTIKKTKAKQFNVHTFLLGTFQSLSLHEIYRL